MKNLLFSLFMCIGVIATGQVSEQDSVRELSEVTIVGERIRTLPGSGQIIRSEKIAKLNQPDINKVLRTIPGVNIRDEEGFGLRPNIGLRGTPVNRSAKITLMEDGILMAPAPYSDPAAYYFPTFARIESVEVLKGSSQIKYGPYTIGGAINLLSTAIPKEFKGFAQVSVGSFGSSQQRFWVGDSRRNFDYVFEVNRLASNGFKDLDGGGNTGFERRDFMGKLRWHSSKDSKLPQSLTLKFVNMTESGNESYLGLTFDDFIANPNRRYSATQRDILDMNHFHVSLQHAIRPIEGMQITSTGYYGTTFRDWSRVNSVGGQSLNNILSNPETHIIPYQIMVGAANGEITYQSAARTFGIRGVQSHLDYTFRTGKLRYHLHTGIRYHEDEADRYATQSNYVMNNGTMILTAAGIRGNRENQIRKARSVASFIQLDLKYGRMTLSPGIRQEQIRLELLQYGMNDFGRLGTSLQNAVNEVAVILPGMGFHYQFGDWSGLFAGVHKGFSPPGMPSVNSEAEQARPETAMSYELGYRYNHSHLKGEISGFWNQYDNILGSDNMSGGGAGTGDMFNAGGARVRGLELRIEYDLMATFKAVESYKIPISMAYTYTNPKFGETFRNGGGDWGSGIIQEGDIIPFITPQLLTVTVGVELPKFNITAIGRYVGKTRTRPGQEAPILPAFGEEYNAVNSISEYFVVDLSANYIFRKKITVFSLLNNLFNKSYIVANLPQGYRPGMPFGVNIGVKAAF
jgi:Fe(3+) dicitrate transport protein